MMNALYEYYEVVKIQSSKPSLSTINGLEAAVLGRTQNEDGQWLYSVQLLATEDGWEVIESDLRALGRMMKREDFYDGDSLTVRVDSITGNGELKK